MSDLVDAALLRYADLTAASRDMLPTSVIAQRALACAQDIRPLADAVVSERLSRQRAEQQAARDAEQCEQLLQQHTAAVKLIRAAPRPLSEGPAAVLLHNLLLTLESSRDPQAVTA